VVDLGGLGKVERALLSDPQTSGGLLVTRAPSAVGDVLRLFRTKASRTRR
jgi:selenide, water dikinase